MRQKDGPMNIQGNGLPQRNYHSGASRKRDCVIFPYSVEECDGSVALVASSMLLIGGSKPMGI